MPHTTPANPRPHATPAEIEQLRLELLGQRKPADEKPDPYRIYREQRAADVDRTIAQFTEQLAELTEGTEDADALRAMYRSLLTAQQRAKRAIGNIPNSAITVAEETGL
jgi:hypothetical protein